MGYQDAGIPGIPGYWDIVIAGIPGIPGSRILECRDTRKHGYQYTGIPVYRDTGIHGYRDKGIPVIPRIPGYRDTRIQGYRDTWIQG